MNVANAVRTAVRSRKRTVSLSVMVFARVLLGVACAITTISAWPVSAMAMDESASGVILVFEGTPVHLDARALRDAIANELGVAVTLAPAASLEHPILVLRGDSEGRVTLTYHADTERSISRSIDLPDDPTRATETLALLAGNLVRDEAAELVASLGKRPHQTPEAPETTETPANETAPPPDSALPEATTPKPRVMERHAKPSVPAPLVNKRETLPSSVCAVRPQDVVIFGADVIPFVGMSKTGVDLGRRYSLNFLGGYIEGLSGVEASLGVNIEGSFMCGFQLANVGNFVAGPARGVQLTAGVNVATSLDGLQFGSVNVSAGYLAGVQLGGVNVVAQNATGVQAGLLNISAGEMSGAQIGLVNFTNGNVKGMQLGLVNIAARTTFSLGLLNIIPQGRTHLDLWALESGIVMFGIKHGSDYLHNIYGAGIRASGERVDASFSLGLGGHIPISKRLYADIDALGYSFHKAPSFVPHAIMIQARTVIGVRLASRFAVYGGPTYNVAYAPIADDSVLSPYGSTVVGDGGEAPIRGWPGAVVGVQLF